MFEEFWRDIHRKRKVNEVKVRLGIETETDFIERRI